MQLLDCRASVIQEGRSRRRGEGGEGRQGGEIEGERRNHEGRGEGWRHTFGSCTLETISSIKGAVEISY